jgi:hypothetical protein
MDGSDGEDPCEEEEYAIALAVAVLLVIIRPESNVSKGIVMKVGGLLKKGMVLSSHPLVELYATDTLGG